MTACNHPAVTLAAEATGPIRVECRACAELLLALTIDRRKP